jgi:fatty-acyl-CoA synthase
MADAVKVYRAELTPLSFLLRSAAIFPERVAIVHGERRYTYADFADRVLRLAGALRAAGIRRGDRVAYVCPNTPAMLEGQFGVTAAGAVIVPINVRLNRDEVAFILSHSGASLVVVDHELAHLVEGSGVEAVRVDDTGQPSDQYEQFLLTGPGAEQSEAVVDEEDVISINYTSGTTGTPKGVMITHRGGFLNAVSNVIESRLSYDTVYLWTLPMFHCNGWCFAWAVTAVAGRHICLRRIDVPQIWTLLETEGVTNVCGAPTVFVSLVNHPDARRLDRPVIVTTGGAPPSPTLLERMDELNLHPIHLYGLTETYGPMTVCVEHPEWVALPLESRARLLARQGQPLVAHSPVRVVDAELRDVPKDAATVGEVVMHGNNVMKGYYRDPEATDRAFVGGWFHSGDLAIWHPDGYIELRDRAKDIIISGGENISTIEVEQVIAKHPAVLECAVVAIPDEKWGERPKAFVTLKSGQTATEQEIVDFCRDRLAHFKAPAVVEFGELPKTSTGKIQKYLLREREWAGRETRIGAA